MICDSRWVAREGGYFDMFRVSSVIYSMIYDVGVGVGIVRVGVFGVGVVVIGVVAVGVVAVGGVVGIVLVLQ